MTNQTTSWTSLGISFGPGIGFTIGIAGWGYDGIALGLIFGTGIGLALGAALDAAKDNPGA